MLVKLGAEKAAPIWNPNRGRFFGVWRLVPRGCVPLKLESLSAHVCPVSDALKLDTRGFPGRRAHAATAGRTSPSVTFSWHAPNSAKNRPQPDTAIPEVTGGGKARRVSSGSVVRRAAFI